MRFHVVYFFTGLVRGGRFSNYLFFTHSRQDFGVIVSFLRLFTYYVFVNFSFLLCNVLCLMYRACFNCNFSSRFPVINLLASLRNDAETEVLVVIVIVLLDLDWLRSLGDDAFHNPGHRSRHCGWSTGHLLHRRC